MKRQEMFDKVARHLLTQKMRAELLIGDCRYRLGNLSCSIGCLILDDAYNPLLEGLEVADPSVLAALRASGVKPLNRQTIHLLEDLQEIHDNGNPMEWRSELEETARSWHLKTDVLEVCDE